MKSIKLHALKAIVATTVALVTGSAMAQTYPADKTELELLDYWRLDTTLPNGSNYTSILNKSPTELNTYTHTYFSVITGGGVKMQAQFGGAVTSSSTAYSRTELREMANSTTVAGWDCDAKKKEMFVRMKVKKTPFAKPEVSVAQIHDGSSDAFMVYYQYDKAQNANVLPATGIDGNKGKMIAVWNGGATTEVLDSSYVVGNTFTLQVRANGTGTSGYPGDDNFKVVYVNESQANKTTNFTHNFTGTSNACYFKTGNYHHGCTKNFIGGTANASCTAKAYPQSNGFTWELQGNSNLTSEVVLYNLTVTPKGN